MHTYEHCVDLMSDIVMRKHTAGVLMSILFWCNSYNLLLNFVQVDLLLSYHVRGARTPCFSCTS